MEVLKVKKRKIETFCILCNKDSLRNGNYKKLVGTV